MSSSIEISNNVSKTQLENVPFSDHAAIILIISIQPNEAAIDTIKNYSKANWPKLQSFIEHKTNQLNIPTNRHVSAFEIESITEKISDIYNEGINKCIFQILKSK